MVIRSIEEKDYKEKGYVHYKSWIETYTGLMDASFLSKHTLDKCVQMAIKYPEHNIVAEVDQHIVGFATYGKARDEDEETGEIIAIYVLKAYQRKGIGKALMDECLLRLSAFHKIIVWVLSTNQPSIDWYERYGFIKDGKTKRVKVMENYTLDEIRLTLHR